MPLLFVCHPTCSTCQRARRFLEEQGAEFTARDIRQQNPTVEELRLWQARSGLPLRRFVNTSGQVYRALGLKDRLPSLSEAELLKLLASDGMLVRRPILVGEDFVCVGFRAAEWQAALSGEGKE